jgi:hypothetical protein
VLSIETPTLPSPPEEAPDPTDTPDDSQ